MSSKNTFNVLKNIVLLIYRKLHFYFICRLNSREYEGIYFKTTSVKLLRKTFHDLSFDNGLTVRGSKFNGNDPFTKALKLVDGQLCKSTFKKKLHYSLMRQKDEVISNYISNERSFHYGSYPIWSMCYPWDMYTFDTFKDNYLQLVMQNRSEHSFVNNPNPIDYIYSKEFVCSHYEQFNKLYLSIDKKGFNRSMPRPKVIILKNKNHWKWIMSGQGNHRAYILFLLNYKYLPCEIIQVVNISDINNWHNVQNGIYSKTDAEKFFFFLYSGNHICKGIV